MIQILGLRKFTVKTGPDIGKEKTYDAFHDKNWRAPSLAELFANIDAYLEKIPATDHFNLFYTIANCKAEKRKFLSQDVVAFDFDGIDKTKIDDYVNIFHAVVGLSLDVTARVSSGNGLHVIVQLDKPFKSETYFDENRQHFKAVANKINFELAKNALSGHVDTSIFGPGKILRLPGTVNRKPDKPDTRCVMLKSTMTPVSFDVAKLSDLPTVEKKDQLSEKLMRKFAKADNDAVLTGCDFLKWARDNPNEIDEPSWYAALSITARLEDGRAASHDLSRGHSNYSPEETDKKIDQALEASGPRTCDNINALWSKCATCPNYKKKLSPLLLVGEGHIATEHTGFHNYVLKGTGANVEEKAVPAFEDLRLFFKREHRYKVLARQVYAWNGTHYETWSDAQVAQFAHEHFEPKSSMRMRIEFQNLVHSTELVDISWFEKSTERKANFLNGYYDFDKKEFLPHSSDIGFRSVLPFKYDPIATCPVYDRMLERIACGVKSLQDVLNEIGGYVISGDEQWMQRGIILEGTGANGKSTWLGALKKVVGRDSYSTLTTRDLERSEYNTQLLDRMLVNIAEEMPTDAMVETDLFKRLVVDGELTVRAIRKEPYKIRNKAKMIYTCNELPAARDTSDAYFRRLTIVPFRAAFLKKDADFDPFIERKLADELPGIFNRFLEGYARLSAAGKLTECTIMDRTKNMYQSEIDTITTWFKENIVVYPLGGKEGKTLSMKELYGFYSGELEDINARPLSYNQFCKKLASIVPDYEVRHKKARFGAEQKKSLHNVDYIIGNGLEEMLPKDVIELRPGMN